MSSLNRVHRGPRWPTKSSDRHTRTNKTRPRKTKEQRSPATSGAEYKQVHDHEQLYCFSSTATPTYLLTPLAHFLRKFATKIRAIATYMIFSKSGKLRVCGPMEGSGYSDFMGCLPPPCRDSKTSMEPGPPINRSISAETAQTPRLESRNTESATSICG